MEDLDCKMFVATDLDRSTLGQRIGTHFGGEVKGKYVSAATMAIEIRENEDFAPDRCDDAENGFLFYRLCLEIEPAQGASRVEYVRDVGAILSLLRSEGWRALAACDFEDELPR